YRLSGPLLVHAGSADIVSDATPPGAIQVPANQQPIMLMADRQTTGGYPKIAVIISADLPLAAQLMPDDSIGFTVVNVREAQAMAREQQARLEKALADF
ncbi:MAG TPA: KipI antagonist, partial [Nitrospiraceae bacterium]|nr:KipI antagonist [Nitrospiraceae bacterium]